MNRAYSTIEWKPLSEYKDPLSRRVLIKVKGIENIYIGLIGEAFIVYEDPDKDIDSTWIRIEYVEAWAELPKFEGSIQPSNDEDDFLREAKDYMDDLKYFVEVQYYDKGERYKNLLNAVHNVEAAMKFLKDNPKHGYDKKPWSDS